MQRFYIFGYRALMFCARDSKLSGGTRYPWLADSLNAFLPRLPVSTMYTHNLFKTDKFHPVLWKYPHLCLTGRLYVKMWPCNNQFQTKINELIIGLLSTGLLLALLSTKGFLLLADILTKFFKACLHTIIHLTYSVSQKNAILFNCSLFTT